MALVVWAAVLEARRPRRGWPVFVLLALAGLLRPEAWSLAGLYLLWMSLDGAPGASARATRRWRRRARWLGAVDFAVTATRCSRCTTRAPRRRTRAPAHAGEIPSALPAFFASLVKLPVLLAALLGSAFAVLAGPAAGGMPLVLLLSGIGTFVLIGIAGAVGDRALPDRRRAGPARVRRVALGGFTMLRAGRLRTGWRRCRSLRGASARAASPPPRRPHAPRPTSCSSAATRTTSLVRACSATRR
jgi:hypothetical protein